MLAYTAKLTQDEEDRGYVVTFRDVPEAITQGETLDEALRNAADALAVALEFYAEDRRRFPKSSEPRPGEHLITLPALVAAKLELYRRMRETGTTRAALARMFGVDERAVRGLLASKHRSHIGQIEAALAKLGKRLEISVRDAAWPGVIFRAHARPMRRTAPG
jgi:antitoxin HicB